MPRKRHVSRNMEQYARLTKEFVMPRKRHVSRNYQSNRRNRRYVRHASQEACE